MKMVDKFDYQLADEVLRLEILYSNLYRAYVSGNRMEMIKFYEEAQNIDVPNFDEAILGESKKLFGLRYRFMDIINTPIRQLPFEQLKLNVEGCLNALIKELNRRNMYRTNYTYAQYVLYHPCRIFKQEDVIYEDNSGRQLKVADFLAVSKYAMNIAETIAPGNDEYMMANAVISVLRGIDGILNNRKEDAPVNKMLHLVTSFISSVVKSALRNDEMKRNMTVTSTMVDLVIDFLVKE